MTLRIDSVENTAGLIGAMVQEIFPALSLHFIVHGRGQLSERIALSEHEIVRHPAAPVARHILKKAYGHDRSSFLGLAVTPQKGFMGLTSRDHALALFNVNISEFDTMEDIKTHLYHMVWHAVDLMDIRQKPEYRKKFAAGPIVPKRSPMNLAKANLQADVFAAVMGGLTGEKDSLTLLARRRADYSLLPIATTRAEDYPFIIAMEATQFAYSQLNRGTLPKNKFIEKARQISLEIGFTFDEVSIRQWWAFAEPAQDMAWRGHAREEILGAAVFTSEDPYVRSIGYLISEVLEVAALPDFEMIKTYNAFMDSERNKALHREIMDDVFQEAIELGLEEESGQPLLNAANRQNEYLSEGKIIGWCASALQSAARAFEQAMVTGSSPDAAARQEFEGARGQMSWESIRELGDTIVAQRRLGQAITMGSIAEICNEHPLFAPILGSIKITMNDPSYIRKLEAANDLAFGAPAPSAPALKGPAPSGPAPKAPQMAPPAAAMLPALPPGLGGSRGAQLIRQRLLQQQQQMQRDKENAGSDDTTTRT